MHQAPSWGFSRIILALNLQQITSALLLGSGWGPVNTQRGNWAAEFAQSELLKKLNIYWKVIKSSLGNDHLHLLNKNYLLDLLPSTVVICVSPSKEDLTRLQQQQPLRQEGRLQLLPVCYMSLWKYYWSMRHVHCCTPKSSRFLWIWLYGGALQGPIPRRRKPGLLVYHVHKGPFESVLV